MPSSISSSPQSRTPSARLRPDRLAHGGDDLEQEPGAALERAAVGVGAPVGGAREEAAHERGVRALQLDPVEAARPAVAGDERVAGDDLGDLACVDRLRHLAEQRVGDRRRRPDRQARVHPRALPAVVVDLGEDRDVVAVHGVGDRAVAGDDLGPEAVDELLVGPVGRVGRVLLGDDEPGAAGGPRGVVRGVALGREPVLGVVRQVGREDDAVPHRRPGRAGAGRRGDGSGRAHAGTAGRATRSSREGGAAAFDGSPRGRCAARPRRRRTIRAEFGRRCRQPVAGVDDHRGRQIADAPPPKRSSTTTSPSRTTRSTARRTIATPARRSRPLAATRSPLSDEHRPDDLVGRDERGRDAAARRAARRRRPRSARRSGSQTTTGPAGDDAALEQGARPRRRGRPPPTA